ncbi:hypothetical protein V5O48_005989 [Marasmius crinis-equi]|uniref:Arrestin C-terminal-like domain-containing protein n=1 Tax=Marasmius crinis-equi TaxID=585013 RepID=A0ABR3FKT4_9AGAR
MSDQDQLPPPTYSQQETDDADSVGETQSDSPPQPQILIVPTVVNFQKGFLGADGERAAIEGELQLKGAKPEDWNKVTVSLRTVESAYSREIELYGSEVVLFTQAPDMPATALPSSMLFAIPLMQDTPQSIHTPISFLTHTLTATLHPTDPTAPPLTKSLAVHTRRYTSHTHTLPVSPARRKLTVPTQVEVEVPRTTFRSGESIPVYVQIPPPRRELVMDESLRLRNIKTELVRVIRVRQDDDDDDEGEGGRVSLDSRVVEGTSTSLLSPSEKPRLSTSLKTPVSPHFLGPSYTAVLARSGAACRFHSSKTVQQRFILHQVSPLSSPSHPSLNLPGFNLDSLDSDVEASSISQVTLFHSVSFQLNVHVALVDVSARSERVLSVSFPITMLPPPAPLPEVEPGIYEEYSKKHDRPPAQTNRYDGDSEHSAPHYTPGEAGPSVLPHVAPPPFDEPEAPPPFFSSAAEASTSARLPTFLESETEIIIPDDPEQHIQLEHTHPMVMVIEGEGILFGFPASEQFDGHSQDIQRSSTPPPTLEMASRDPNVTQLADITEPERAMEAIELVLSQANAEQELPPPPPPALDDPSDPPPSIDSDFRSPDSSRQSPPPPPPAPGTSSPPLHPIYTGEQNHLRSSPSRPAGQAQPVDGNAPPPYLVRDNHTVDQEQVNRPPPYVD